MKPEEPKLEQLGALRELWQEAFGDGSSFLDGFFATAFDPERCLCIGAGERIASAVYWLDVELESGKGAYLYALATAESHRGKGLAHAVMRAAHGKLRQRGYVAAILVPGSRELETFYGAMGYRFFAGIRNFGTVAKQPAAVLREIGPAAYGELRRQYLPAGAVVQDGRNLEFLASCARLYAGEDFLLAAWQEKDTLRGLELLGNAARAPHILEALGAGQGSFRTPGEEKFAMWLPLADCKTPGYFGLAFD